MSQSLSKWRMHISKHQESGLSVKEYCSRHRITPGKFWYYKKKLLKLSEQKNFMAARVLPEPATDRIPALSLVFDAGFRLEIGSDADPGQLVELINLLKTSA